MTAPPPHTCPAISRVDIAWTCVATNDPHPLHLDHIFAREAGYQDVVVPGTMIAGWIGEFLAHWAGGAHNVPDWRIRFLAPLWPDDQVTIQCRLLDTPHGAATKSCEITGTAADGRLVARAWAEVTAAGG